MYLPGTHTRQKQERVLDIDNWYHELLPPQEQQNIWKCFPIYYAIMVTFKEDPGF